MSDDKPYCYPDQSPEKDNCTMPDAQPDMKPAVSTPAPSPTGTPVLPPRLVPYGVALLGILGGIAALPTLGISLLPVALTQGALVGVLVLGPLLGMASPGLRKKDG